MSEECGSELNSVGYYSFSGFDTKTPFLIGVAGGTASGKTSVCRKIMSRVGQEGQVVCIHQDNFYKGLSPLERDRANRGLFNYDHPDVFDDELMAATLGDILQEKVVQVPVYDFITSTRVRDQWISIAPADVVLVEGVLLFYFPRLRDMFHMKLFVDTDPDTRLARRVLRDVKERGRDLEKVLHQYTNFVKPAFEEFCLPLADDGGICSSRQARGVSGWLVQRCCHQVDGATCFAESQTPVLDQIPAVVLYCATLEIKKLGLYLAKTAYVHSSLCYLCHVCRAIEFAAILFIVVQYQCVLKSSLDLICDLAFNPLTRSTNILKALPGTGDDDCSPVVQ